MSVLPLSPQEEKFLREDAMRIVTRTNGYPLLFDVVWPLSRVRHFAKVGNPSAARFVWFEKMRRTFPVEET